MDAAGEGEGLAGGGGEGMKTVADFWEDHCVECGEPVCFKSCPKFRRGAHGRCERVEMPGGGCARFRERADGVAGGSEALECVERAAGADRPLAAEGSEMDSFPLRAGSVRDLQKLKMALCAPLLQIERDACEVALCGFVEKSGRACHGGSKRRRGCAPSQQG